ncbi:GNAT family N-acetyltransferase [Massilia sp. YIM B02763]|uniref:GNAT family N-acetyltransferase n=1 Tax=Massilia sp. YIM B02763 TaxID=3050130 RepID=UPI0025B70392|nr:GNAT family N-acetyltransferase [Massilia sp. YIM B02763]MDN4051513.1 GNAT family N-acetyltransferase [Massilia sp. YIM B02763]
MTDRAPSFLLRAMRDDDLDAVLAVQAACYPAAMQEGADVVLARRRAAPATALVACDGSGVCGYLFAYPSLRGKVTPLGGAFRVPEVADTLYLHDLAVAPRALGKGLARRLVQRMHDAGAQLGLAHAALVSVQDSRCFWEGFGYVAAQGDAAALASYPPGALYMLRSAGEAR